MKGIQNHIDEMFKNIPESEQKENIIRDIVQNLEEKVWDLVEQGKSEEDAINKAIVEFGDIEDIKRELGGAVPLKLKKDKVRNQLGFSICGSILIISLFVFINFYYSPDTIWFVYPTFGILWWPLVMFYRWLNLK